MEQRVPFRYLSANDFNALSVEEKMDYLRRAMTDLRGKLEETGEQAGVTLSDKDSPAHAFSPPTSDGE